MGYELAVPEWLKATALPASVALFSALITLGNALILWRQNRRTYGAAREARLEDMYDRLMDYRLKHPEVFKLSRQWKPECLTKIYALETEECRQWAIYIGYVELCISYCNATLHAWKRRQIDLGVYRSQHEPLVRLLITEHFPIIRPLAREGGFVSSGIASYIARLRKEGWDWEREYENMDKVR